MIGTSQAMYKNRNRGMGNGMGGMLYSGECRKTFWGMLPNIPGNVLKDSRECHKTFQGMSPSIPECPRTFWGMS